MPDDPLQGILRQHEAMQDVRRQSQAASAPSRSTAAGHGSLPAWVVPWHRPGSPGGSQVTGPHPRHDSVWRSAQLLVVLLASGFLWMPSPATAFGTIEGGGQHREHERITRAALACPAGGGSSGDCFEPKSSDQLAGHRTSFGAVGAPDRTEVSDSAAHCDDADHLEGGYPRTRAQATGRLLDCVEHLRGRFREAVNAAAGLLDDQAEVVGVEVDLGIDCVLDDGSEHRAKCETVEAFGRALHGVQDFYSHSNWTDVADSSRPVGADNPPGLGLLAPSSVLDLSGAGSPAVPAALSTGCFVLNDRIPGVGACQGRITHAGLNKDNGTVDPSTGSVTAPTTPRGQVADNFARAVTGAIAESRHQWQEFRVALEAGYGRSKASVMICALTHDDPVNDCRRLWTVTVVLVISVGLICLVGTGFLVSRIRRRRGRLMRRG
ncbi:CinY protein [Actinoplanes sp. NPDC023936]|uniref:CinY protein n=1 Tax=Actinoplanes sp. NPDC023936 TaxID=3154910 RepID=UPI0033FC4FD6